MGEKEEEFMGIKFKNGIPVRERGGKSTPSPTWRFGPFHPQDTCSPPVAQGFNLPTTKPTLSARQIGASFWEISQPHQVNMMMRKSGGGGGAPLPPRHLHQKNQTQVDEDLMGIDDQLAAANSFLDAPPHTPLQLPEIASSLRRRVKESLIQHNPSVERNDKNIQHASPASYTSSIEVETYNHAVTPASSLDFGGRIRDTNYSLKSSTDLVKVLNRIWTLEEQQASNISLIKALTRERDLSRSKMKDLFQERKRDHQEINKLKKQIRAIQSANDELEDERKLRKHSESLHRKLAREFSESKSLILNLIKDFEREKKARVLLENLCDEFAKAISNYEQEQRLTKQKPERDVTKREHHPDRLILHVSEAWLDERMQMKLAEARCDFSERSFITDKLSYEIETFLQAKQKSSAGLEYNDEIGFKKHKQSRSRRHSLESSFHLKEAGNALKNGVWGDNSIDIGYCFELNHGSTGKQEVIGSSKLKSNSTKKLVCQREPREEKSVEVKHSQLEKSEITQEELQDSKTSRAGAQAQAQESKSTYTRDDFVSSALEEGIDESFEHSETAGRSTTTVREWMSRITSADPDACESSSKWSRGDHVKENTLKAKLLEARLENQQFRPRSVKGSF